MLSVDGARCRSSVPTLIFLLEFLYKVYKWALPLLQVLFEIKSSRHTLVGFFKTHTHVSWCPGLYDGPYVRLCKTESSVTRKRQKLPKLTFFGAWPRERMEATKPQLDGLVQPGVRPSDESDTFAQAVSSGATTPAGVCGRVCGT